MNNNGMSVRDEYYQYQVQKLGDIIGGQQTLVIPPSEEERRVDVNAKYHRFLQENPLQISPAMRAMKLAKIALEQKKEDEKDKEEEIQCSRCRRNLETYSCTICCWSKTKTKDDSTEYSSFRQQSMKFEEIDHQQRVSFLQRQLYHLEKYFNQHRTINFNDHTENLHRILKD